MIEGGTSDRPYASEPNPVEPVWSNLERSLADLTEHDIGQVTALVKTRLRQVQYRPCLLDGFLAKTGLYLSTSTIEESLASPGVCSAFPA